MEPGDLIQNMKSGRYGVVIRRLGLCVVVTPYRVDGLGTFHFDRRVSWLISGTRPVTSDHFLAAGLTPGERAQIMDIIRKS